MGVKLQSALGGSVELNAPSTASNFTMTVPPVNNGTLIVSDTNGSVGIGTTLTTNLDPVGNQKYLELGAVTTLSTYNSGDNVQSNILTNVTFTPTGAVYKSSGAKANAFRSIYGGFYMSTTTSTGTAGAACTLTDKFVFTNAGQLGIQVTPGGDLANRPAIAIGDSDTGVLQAGDGHLKFYNNNVRTCEVLPNGGWQFYNNRQTTWDQRTILLEDGSGGSGAPGIGFHAPTNSTAGILKFWGPSSSFEFRNSTDSGFVNVLAAAFVPSSDYRLKENVADLGDALNDIVRLRPVRFSWKETNKPDVGFLAHEVQDVLPEAVFGEKDGVRSDGSLDLQGVNQNPLVALCVKAIQEQQAIIESLKARLDAAGL